LQIAICKERRIDHSEGATMHRISIGTWAYSVGPYADKPIPFGEVVKGLKEMKFDGLELGAFGAHPTPDNHPT
jgi:sugar phosphate isomerase/epimerase